VARYRLVIKQSAAKEIESVGQKRDRRRIVERIQSLSENPRPFGCEKLSGYQDRYRVRMGSYRIVYAIRDEELTVYVVKVGHRKDVYKGV
jgi:mRNA interferase RelE/StbE